jgi:hypothetical protein
LKPIVVNGQWVAAAFANLEMGLLWLAMKRRDDGVYVGFVVERGRHAEREFTREELRALGAKRVSADEIADFQIRTTGIPVPPPRRPITSLAPAASWLLAELARLGATPPARSRLAESLHHVLGAEKELDPLARYDILWNASLAEVLMPVYSRLQPSIETVMRDVFTGTDICFLRAAHSTKPRNQAWELYVGSRAATVAEHVVFAEPDIVATYRGSEWALACKVFYTSDPDNQVDTIISGVKQIEKSPHRAGVVLANVSNLVNHELFMTKAGWVNYPSVEVVRDVLAKETARVRDAFRTRPGLVKRMQDREKTRGIFLVGMALAFVQGAPMMFHHTKRLHVPQRVAVPEEFITSLADSL